MKSLPERLASTDKQQEFTKLLRCSGISVWTGITLPDTRYFARLAATGIVVLGVAGAFLYLGDWFNPEALTPARFADGFERVDGIFSGFRLNHAKGVCVSEARAFQRL